MQIVAMFQSQAASSSAAGVSFSLLFLELSHTEKLYT